MLVMEPKRVIITIVAVFAVFLLVAWVVSWFTGDSDSQVLSTTEKVSLAASADTELVTRVTTYGKIINEEDYRSIRISVSRNKRTLEVMAGYNNVVTERKTYKNNQAAFESFLLALEKQGFTKSREGVTDDERGYCASSTRIVYEVLGNIDNQQRLWSASCAKKHQTFDGDSSDVQKLFKAQIPDYSDLTRGVKL